MITIFTDGSSRGNPGPGGWAAIVIGEKTVQELGGRESHTTNNRMEIKAAAEGVRIAKNTGEKDITVYTDSSYLINGITKWVKNWKARDWVTIKKEDVLNRDLWTDLDASVTGLNVSWKYVGGHIGVPGNERCDAIATAMADEEKIELFNGDFSSYSIPNILDVSDVQIQSDNKLRKNTQAYSYVSMVNKKIETFKTWPECEKKVKGVRGAKFKKAVNAEDEEKIIAEFQALR